MLLKVCQELAFRRRLSWPEAPWGLAGLGPLGATLAHQLHAAAADGEGHDQLKKEQHMNQILA